MPLISTIGNIHSKNPHYVRFAMEGRERLVTIHISAHALRQRAARDGIRSQNIRLLFAAYRDEIEAAASIKYDAGHRDGADVVIADRDLVASASEPVSPPLVPSQHGSALSPGHS